MCTAAHGTTGEGGVYGPVLGRPSVGCARLRLKGIDNGFERQKQGAALGRVLHELRAFHVEIPSFVVDGVNEDRSNAKNLRPLNDALEGVVKEIGA